MADSIEPLSHPAELIIPSPDSSEAKAARERVREAMRIIKAELEREEHPAVLCPPASEEEVASYALMPEGLRELYRMNNGQEPVDEGDCQTGIFVAPPGGGRLALLPLDSIDFAAEPETGSYAEYLRELDEEEEEDEDEKRPTVEEVVGDLELYEELGQTVFGEFFYPGTCNNLVVTHYMEKGSKQLVHEVYFVLEPSDDTYEEMAYVPYQCGVFYSEDCVQGRLRPSPFRFSYWLEAYAKSLVEEKSEEELEEERKAAGWTDYSEFADWFHCKRPRAVTAKSAVA